MNSTQITGALWKCNILNNPEYHMSSEHGGNMLHKFTHSAKDVILGAYPVGMDKEQKKALLKQASEEYTKHLRTKSAPKKVGA